MNYVNMFKDEINKNENNKIMNGTTNSNFLRKKGKLKKIQNPELKYTSEKLKEKIKELFK